jgi:CheY-like chemotaxis protein
MKHKLLLADDSVTIQRVIELTFADEDVDVVAVGDGQLAIDRLEADPPDIVLADVDMPKRDGYEVAAYVKSRPKLAHIPVVLLTGAFEPVDQARAERAGSSDVLAKPFEPQMVINRVKQLLARKTENEERQPASSATATHRPQTSSVAVADDKPVPTPTTQSRPSAPLSSKGTAPLPVRAEAAEERPVSLDDYFDQLDAAFSNLHQTSVPTDAGTMQAEQDWIESQRSPASMDSSVRKQDLTSFDLPDLNIQEAISVATAATAVSPAPPAPAVSASQTDVADSATIERYAAPVMSVPEPPPAPAAASPQSATVPAASPATAVSEAPSLETRPAAPARQTVNPFAELSAVRAEAAAARAAASVTITDDVIEEVVSRVLQRLTDRVVRETVTEIVSQTAERLVQEEIQRIKAEGQ